MPAYAKYIKELVSNKKKLEEYATVTLTEKCSAILQKKLPPKLTNPGSFTIPRDIGCNIFENCLCDLDTSVNLMPYSPYKKLSIIDIKPINVTLQLVDRSLRCPYGVVEDVIIKVGELYILADFIILNIENN